MRRVSVCGVRRPKGFACKMGGAGVPTCSRLDFLNMKHFLSIRSIPTYQIAIPSFIA